MEINHGEILIDLMIGHNNTMGIIFLNLILDGGMEDNYFTKLKEAECDSELAIKRTFGFPEDEDFQG